MIDLILASTIILYGDQDGLWSPSHCKDTYLPCSREERVVRPILQEEEDVKQPENESSDDV